MTDLECYIITPAQKNRNWSPVPWLDLAPTPLNKGPHSVSFIVHRGPALLTDPDYADQLAWLEANCPRRAVKRDDINPPRTEPA